MRGLTHYHSSFHSLLEVKSGRSIRAVRLNETAISFGGEFSANARRVERERGLFDNKVREGR